ncbi:MAG TPA: response regulator [Acidimicrobiales bacterium]|nr:response regulator [Acidimicrobiales bacterium]
MGQQAIVRTVVVDDSVDIRLMLRLLLGRDARFEIVGEAANGREAVELCERVHPDLVILDRQMPVMGGLEAIPLIRDRWPGAQIVLYTAAAEPDTEEAAAAAGALGVLHKQSAAMDVAGDLTRLLARRGGPGPETAGDVEVRLGPVPSAAARAWVANTRQILGALQLRPDAIGGPITEPVMAMFGRFLDAWETVAQDTDVFFWTGRADPQDVQKVVEEWARIDSIDDATLAALGCDWTPPEGQAFFAALAAAVVDALADHEETRRLAERLGGDWASSN